MSNLEIPERAYEIGEAAYYNSNLCGISIPRYQLDTAIEAAAPIIVAAYIRNVLMPAATELMDGTDAWLDLHARNLDPEGES